MRRATIPALTALLAVCALLVGCAAPPSPPTPTPPGTTTPSVVDFDPGAESVALGLVNLWRVSGAEGESPHTWLRLEAGGFQLWRSCGMIDGSWQATETLFIGSVFGSSGACATKELPTVPWLNKVTGYRHVGDGWELTGASGQVLASLRIDGAPKPIPTAAEFFTQPPEITEHIRASLRQRAPLAAGLSPASREQLSGTWVPSGAAKKTHPHVTFAGDAWTGSDGCNGASGRWTIDAKGAFLATSGAMTQIGCDGAPVPSWIALARTAALDGNTLTLFDLAGSKIATLQRD